MWPVCLMSVAPPTCCRMEQASTTMDIKNRPYNKLPHYPESGTSRSLNTGMCFCHPTTHFFPQPPPRLHSRQKCRLLRAPWISSLDSLQILSSVQMQDGELHCGSPPTIPLTQRSERPTSDVFLVITMSRNGKKGTCTNSLSPSLNARPRLPFHSMLETATQE